MSGKYWLGIGCKRHTSRENFEQAIGWVCRRYQINREAIAGIATIDRKVQEQGLLEYCRRHGLPLKTFSAAALSLVKVPSPREEVATQVGSASVAEAAALLASQGQLLVPKQIIEGRVTIAIAVSPSPKSENHAV